MPNDKLTPRYDPIKMKNKLYFLNDVAIKYRFDLMDINDHYRDKNFPDDNMFINSKTRKCDKDIKSFGNLFRNQDFYNFQIRAENLRHKIINSGVLDFIDNSDHTSLVKNKNFHKNNLQENLRKNSIPNLNEDLYIYKNFKLNELRQIKNKNKELFKFVPTPKIKIEKGEIKNNNESNFKNKHNFRIFKPSMIKKRTHILKNNEEDLNEYITIQTESSPQINISKKLSLMIDHNDKNDYFKNRLLDENEIEQIRNEKSKFTTINSHIYSENNYKIKNLNDLLEYEDDYIINECITTPNHIFNSGNKNKKKQNIFPNIHNDNEYLVSKTENNVPINNVNSPVNNVNNKRINFKEINTKKDNYIVNGYNNKLNNITERIHQELNKVNKNFDSLNSEINNKDEDEFISSENLFKNKRAKNVLMKSFKHINK